MEDSTLYNIINAEAIELEAVDETVLETNITTSSLCK